MAVDPYFALLGSNRDALQTGGGSSEARDLYLKQAYRDLLGREADPAGLSFWAQDKNFNEAMKDNTLIDNFLGAGMQPQMYGDLPWDQAYTRQKGIGDRAAMFDGYQERAQAATQGINNMPYVFSEYGSVPNDPAASQAMFYAQDQNDYLASLSPVMRGILGVGEATDATAAKDGAKPADGAATSAGTGIIGSALGTAVPGAKNAAANTQGTIGAVGPDGTRPPYEPPSDWQEYSFYNLADASAGSDSAEPMTFYRNAKDDQFYLPDGRKISRAEAMWKPVEFNGQNWIARPGPNQMR